MPSTVFARFWQTDLTRECFLSYLTKDELCLLRLVSQGFCLTLTPAIFKDIKVTFNATSLSRQSRLLALSRVGHHVKNLTFHMAHTDETFLPPLLDPETLEEVSFQYEPQIRPLRPSSSSSDPASSKYGSWDVNDLLVRQYPLLFHAATNTSSFVRFMSTLPHLQHLWISCPGQSHSARHRRDIVDYALISLRMAIQQSDLQSLETLTLDPIHPSATFYLRPNVSIGSTPAATRTTNRIKTLNIAMDSFDTSNSDSSTDHLKTLHTYISSFRNVENLSFRWLGELKGPSPLSLSTEPCTSRPSSLDYSTCISHEKRTSTASRGFSSLRPIRLRKLQRMRLENAIFDASQASSFIMAHRKSLHEFDFDHCQLRSGTWDDALSPLTRISGNEDWKYKQHNKPSSSSPSNSDTDSSSDSDTHSMPRTPLTPPALFTHFPLNEIMDVPIMLSPDEEKPESELIPDQMWQAKDIAFFDLDFDADGHSLLSSWSRRRRGVDALRRFGARIGIPYSVRESDIALDSVRKLLRGCRAWHT